MSSSGGGTDFDAKESRLNNPSGWIELTRYETVRLLIDALLEAPPGHQFNKSELERRTGLSRDSIREHMPFLVELGVVEEIEDGEWSEYQLNDEGKVTKELFELNSAVNSVLGGEPKNVNEGPQVDLSKFDSIAPHILHFDIDVSDISETGGDTQPLLDEPPKGTLANAD